MVTFNEHILEWNLMFSDGNFHFANKKRFFFFVVVVVVVVVVAKTKQNKRVHSLRGSTNPLKAFV